MNEIKGYKKLVNSENSKVFNPFTDPTRSFLGFRDLIFQNKTYDQKIKLLFINEN